ncbi:MAG TPA: hypothetical protein VGW12_16375 [Pyrinomonadaceae bacterium]|nr:hypothetical protein [Pyrinomonadaceae bacterium]
MRRKLGILFLIGITVLAGTQEAARQFDGLKSSLKNFTRASLWSGLIVYAQPVNNGKLPTPQIYYLMPTPEQQQPVSPAAQQPVLADNNNGAAASKPEARNNHGDEAVAAENPEAALVAEAKREAEDAEKSELALNNLPLNLVASQFVAPKAEQKARVYEEVAKNETRMARKFKYEAHVIARTFMREADAAKIAAEAERLAGAHVQLERLKERTHEGAESLHRHLEMRVLRRPVRPERLDRIKVILPPVEARPTALLETSSVGCEKTRVTPEVAPIIPIAPAAVAAPVAKTNVQVLLDEPAAPAAEPGLPAASNGLGNSWTLNCDTEPEQK